MTAGYIFAILTGLFFGLQGTLGKILTRKVSPLIITWASFTFGFPCLFIYLLFDGFPAVEWQDFLTGTAVSFIINSFAWYLFYKALESSTLSRTMPFIAFTPVFLIPVAFIWLNELPDLKGIAGVLLIFAGGYGIHLEGKNIFSPVKSIFRSKGTRIMLLVSFLWSISATAEKIAVVSSSQPFYGSVITFLLGALYFPIVFHKRSNRFSHIRANLPMLFLVGLVNGLTLLFQFTALKFMLVSYVIGFKRAGVIISVLLGILLLDERDAVRKLISTALMVIGVFFIMS
ncbi:MAG: DMT family transporter [Calditrichaeota bacterium]|nr:DMT family transporter [Calditrichota bacterium]RQV93588.1 MAG: DMT family transporter [bacterium]RQW06692.1 MAG: DMT family transporter [Calditrichota bacterium]